MSDEKKKNTCFWIKEGAYIDRYDDTVSILKCPICGFIHHYHHGDTSALDGTWFNFCPNCGTKMEG